MPVRIGFGVGLADMGLNSQLSPLSVSNLFAWYRADSKILASTKVDTFLDLGPNAKHIQQTTDAARATWNATDSNFNGHPSATFAGGQKYLASTASDWTFLHNGLGMTAFVVCRPTIATGMTWLATGNAGTANAHYWLGYNVGASAAHQNWVAIPGNVAINLVAPASSSPLNTVQILENWILDGNSPEAQLLTNGTSRGTINSAVAFSANVASSPLHVGGIVGAGLLVFGQIAEIIIYNRLLLTAERALVRRYLGNRYNLTIV